MAKQVLETIISTQEVEDRVDLLCLSCHIGLAKATTYDPYLSVAPFSVYRLGMKLTDFKSDTDCLSLFCTCGTQSTFYLL